MLFYLIGIKGSGMSALAKILFKSGHIVLGADVDNEFYTMQELKTIHIENIDHVHLTKNFYYVIGNAFIKHPLTQYIINNHFYYQYYPQFLVSFFQNKKWICVAGTHGKTTTTKLLSTICDDTTSLIGDGSGSYGKSDYFILESCEYRNTFLNYKPYISLILNVDYDHVDFFKTKEEYDKSFITFINQSTISIVNGDDFSYRSNHLITYGMKEENQIQFTYHDGIVTILNKHFYLPIKGVKYAYDFVGAYLVAKLLGKTDTYIQRKIDSFQMPKRRFQRTICNGQVVMLDYAHHPNEIKAFYEAAKEEYPKHSIVCIFEPHTLSRLECFLNDFKEALGLFDKCYLYQLFSSIREEHQLKLEEQMYEKLNFPLYQSHVSKELKKKSNSIICFLGAGIIDEAYEQYLKINI